MCYDGRIVGCEVASSRSLGSINRGRSEMTNNAGLVSSSAVSFEVQFINESGLLEPVKDVADELRFSRFTIESIEERE